MIVEEKMEREQSEDKLQKSAEEYMDKIRDMLDNNKKEREQATEMLLNLLEDTCNKLNLITKI